MGLKTKEFIRFQIVFWVIMGLMLFASGVTQMSFKTAFVRNMYYPFAGFIFSFFLAYIYQRFIIEKIRLVIVPVLISSYLAGVFITVSVNPITFGQMGIPLKDLGYGELFSGSLNAGLVLALWSVIYLSLVGTPLIKRKKDNNFLTNFLVDEGTVKKSIPTVDVICLLAAGDYVEVVTEGKKYLKRGYLSDLENKLDPVHFLRIHRSTIIALGEIRDISILPKGQFEFRLTKKHSLTSSRSFQDKIKKTFPQLST